MNNEVITNIKLYAFVVTLGIHTVLIMLSNYKLFLSNHKYGVGQFRQLVLIYSSHLRNY